MADFSVVLLVASQSITFLTVFGRSPFLRVHVSTFTIISGFHWHLNHRLELVCLPSGEASKLLHSACSQKQVL